MRHLPPLLATALLGTVVLGVAACGDTSTPASPVAGAPPAFTLPAGAQLHLVLTTQVTIDEYDVHDEGTGDTKRVSDAVRSEWWLTPDGTFVQSRDEDGLLLETTVQGDGGWRRTGAVTADVTPRELPSVLASAEDLVCLLGWADSWPALSRQTSEAGEAAAIFGGVDRPDRHVFADAETGLLHRIETFAPVGDVPAVNTNALSTLVVEATREVSGAAGAVIPGALLRSVPGPGRDTETRITIESATIVTGADVRDTVRPMLPAPTLGEATRRRRGAANVVFSEHAGPLSDVPRLEAYLRRGLSDAKARPKRAFGLEFDRYPSAERDAAFRMVVPVHLSQEPDSGDLPPGALTRVAPAAEVVAMSYRGALPASEAELAPVLDAVRALGLEPDGPIRVLLPEDLRDTAPGALACEIEVPVRERD